MVYHVVYEDIDQLVDYFPFGDTRLEYHYTLDEQRKFAGLEFDEDTSLNYANARREKVSVKGVKGVRYRLS